MILIHTIYHGSDDKADNVCKQRSQLLTKKIVDRYDSTVVISKATAQMTGSIWQQLF